MEKYLTQGLNEHIDVTATRITQKRFENGNVKTTVFLRRNDFLSYERTGIGERRGHFR